MPLKLDLATPADAPRIAEIHMAAFGPNAMLRAQFPSPQVRRALQGCIEHKALVDIDDPKTTVLVVRDIRDDEAQQEKVPPAVAFAKWSHPIGQDENYTEPPWVWPEGTDMGVLNAWTDTTEGAEDRIMAGNPCYHLSFIGTDPAYERKGAGSMLVQWAIEQSKIHKTPLYLESTLDAAPFYKKLGFTVEDTISLDCVSAEDGRLLYKEAIFMFRPIK